MSASPASKLEVCRVESQLHGYEWDGKMLAKDAIVLQAPSVAPPD